MSDKNTPYPHAAGGWGALKSSLKHIIRSEQAATGVKTLLKANQPGGFDCPGCAWGDGGHSGKIDFCENGVKAIAWEATAKRADADFFARHSVSELMRWDDHNLEKSGRLTQPMLYNAEQDKYFPIDWQQAAQLVAQALNSLEHADQALFYTSGRASNEVAYLYQLFGRSFGTNNFPDCSNLCHEASGVGMTASIGVGKGTVTMADFDQAEAIFVFGQNPGTNHPRMLATLRKASKRGAKVVAINNLKERGLQKFTDPQSPTEMLIASSTDISQFYFTPKLGGDMALLRGMAKVLLGEFETHLALDFIRQHCADFNAYKAAVLATSWDKICAQSGLSEAEIRQLAQIYLGSNKTIFTWAMGITQHQHSVATVQELTNVLLLKGNIGKAGAGACPVRGHSNVQGNRTVGINEKPSAAFLDALELRYRQAVPQQHGASAVEAIHAMLAGKAKVFIGLGGNFAAATPDTKRTYQALRNCDLTVHISTKLNRSHLITGQNALILPCLGRTEVDLQDSGEQCISVEDSMSMVHSSRGQNQPASKWLKSETAIIALLADATLKKRPVDWLALAADYDLIRDEIAAVIPGFENYNQALEAGRGFYLGNTAADKNWQTPSQKANFIANELPQALLHEQNASTTLTPRLSLQTLRSHDQYNTSVYGLDDRYRGIQGERKVIFLNHDDISAQGLENGDTVSIKSYYGDGIERQIDGFKVVAYQIPTGCAAAYYPETNPLIALEAVAKDCGTPAYKSVAISLTKASL